MEKTRKKVRTREEFNTALLLDIVFNPDCQKSVLAAVTEGNSVETSKALKELFVVVGAFIPYRYFIAIQLAEEIEYSGVKYVKDGIDVDTVLLHMSQLIMQLIHTERE